MQYSGSGGPISGLILVAMLRNPYQRVTRYRGTLSWKLERMENKSSHRPLLNLPPSCSSSAVPAESMLTPSDTHTRSSALGFTAQQISRNVFHFTGKMKQHVLIGMKWLYSKEPLGSFPYSFSPLWAHHSHLICPL